MNKSHYQIKQKQDCPAGNVNAILYNFCDLISPFAFLQTKSNLKRDLLQKEILLPREQILSF